MSVICSLWDNEQITMNDLRRDGCHKIT